MPNFTENYNLIKPLATENYDIEQFNNNADIIDEELHNLANANKYDVEEVKTGGIWLDGKPIYRKVIDFGALPTAGSKSVAHGITDIDTLTGFTAYMRGLSGGTVDKTSLYMISPTYFVDDGSTIVRTNVDGTNCNVYATADLTASYGAVVFVLEYTKID